MQTQRSGGFIPFSKKHHNSTSIRHSGIFIPLLFLITLFSMVQSAKAETASPQTQPAPQPANNSTSVMFTSLSGTLPPVLDYHHSPYIVEADVFVTPGSTVSVESGVVLLFSNFTSLHVQGAFYVKGTKEKPVIFTSINDQKYNPNAQVTAAPFDWNGIDLYESAIGTQFEYCTVQFSVYGIRSQTRELKIIESSFLQNGKSNVSIKDSTISIKTNTYSFTATTPVLVTRSSQTTSQQAVSAGAIENIPTAPQKPNTLRQLLRYSGMVLATGSFAALALEYNRYGDAVNEFNRIDNKTKENMEKYNSAEWSAARSSVKRETAVSGTLAGMGVLGLLFFGISFTF